MMAVSATSALSSPPWSLSGPSPGLFRVCVSCLSALSALLSPPCPGLVPCLATPFFLSPPALSGLFSCGHPCNILFRTIVSVYTCTLFSNSWELQEYTVITDVSINIGISGMDVKRTSAESVWGLWHYAGSIYIYIVQCPATEADLLSPGRRPTCSPRRAAVFKIGRGSGERRWEAGRVAFAVGVW